MKRKKDRLDWAFAVSVVLILLLLVGWQAFRAVKCEKQGGEYYARAWVCVKQEIAL